MRNVIQVLQSLMIPGKEAQAVLPARLTEWEVAVVKRALMTFTKNRHGVRVEADGSFTVITDLFRVLPESSRSQFMISYLQTVLPSEVPVGSIRIQSICPFERLHG